MKNNGTQDQTKTNQRNNKKTKREVINPFYLHPLATTASPSGTKIAATYLDPTATPQQATDNRQEQQQQQSLILLPQHPACPVAIKMLLLWLFQLERQYAWMPCM